MSRAAWGWFLRELKLLPISSVYPTLYEGFQALLGKHRALVSHQTKIYLCFDSVAKKERDPSLTTPPYHDYENLHPVVGGQFEKMS